MNLHILVVRLSRCQLHDQILEVALEFHSQSICEILAAKSQMLIILEWLHGPTYEPTCWKESEGNLLLKTEGILEQVSISVINLAAI